MWLMILCITGIFLDHKKDWGFLWHWQWPTALMSDASAERAQDARFHISKYIDNHWVVCEVSGCQHDLQGSWQASLFDGASLLIRHGLIWQDVFYLATNQGIWRSQDGGKTFQRYALSDENITYLAADKTLFAVIDHSQIVQQTTDQIFKTLALAVPDLNALPQEVNLGRLSRDLHYGRGIFGQHVDIWINDVAAVLILLLCGSGLYMWIWRRKPNKQSAHRFRFFLRWHRLVVGPAAVLGILYLSITGILLDHSDDLRTEMRATHFSREHLTPIYQLKSWQQQITSLAALEHKLFIGTRLGLWIASQNQPLQRVYTGYAWSLTRIQNTLYIGGMGSPNALYDGTQLVLAKSVGHMPSDVTQVDSRILWKTHHGLEDSQGEAYPVKLPESNTVALYHAMDALHSGMIFHKQFKWVNDAIALLTLIAMMSGLYRLFKWLKVRWSRRQKANADNYN